MTSDEMGSSLMESIQNNCESHINELSVIWDYIGYENEDRQKRVIEISDEIKEVLLRIIERENKLRLDIESEIESKKRDIADICHSLKVNTYFPPRDLSSFKLLKILKEKHEELEEICNSRRKSYLEHYRGIIQLRWLLDMKDNDEELCNNIRDKFVHENDGDSTDKVQITIKKEYIPLETEITNLESIHHQLQDTYDNLRNRHDDLVQDIGRIAQDIQYKGEVDLEKEVLKKFHELEENEGKENNNELSTKEIKREELKQLNEEVIQDLQKIRMKLVKKKAMLVSTCEELRSYLLSMWYRLGVEEDEKTEFMETHSGYKPDTMEALQEEVNRCQQLKWEQISVYYSGLIDERRDLQQKLLMNPTSTPDIEQHGQNGDDHTNLSEEHVAELEHELERLKEQYELHQELYDTVAMYKKLWLAYVDVETQMKDPAILSNRGGILLKTEKEKKRLLKELPKTEAIVAQAIEKYEKSSRNKFLLWNELSFKEYVSHLQTEFQSKRESSKFKRTNPSPNNSGSQSVAGSPRRMSSATRVK